MKNLLTVSYAILGILLFICVLVFLCNTPSTEWVSSFSGNLISELLGILLTVFLIDKVIEKNQENERKKYKEVAFRQLRGAIYKHLMLLANIFKASALTLPEKRKFENVREFFDDKFIEQIAYLDFSALAPVTPDRQWIDYLSEEFLNFKNSLGKTVEKYSMYLDSESLDLMEEVINSSSMAFILQIPNAYALIKREGNQIRPDFFGQSTVGDTTFRNYINLFVDLVEVHNRYCAEDKKIFIEDYIWRDNIAPKLGDSRYINSR